MKVSSYIVHDYVISIAFSRYEQLLNDWIYDYDLEACLIIRRMMKIKKKTEISSRARNDPPFEESSIHISLPVSLLAAFILRLK